MKHLIIFFFLLQSILSFGQIKGLVTDDKDVPLPSVTVLIENTYNSTSTNDNGLFELNVKKTGKYTIIFQYLGFKTKKITVDINNFPHQLNVKLVEANYTLNEVVINNQEDPAIQIIKNAIAAKKTNSEKMDKYNADFYSRGIVKIKDAPKKIFGRDLGDFEGALDSTRTGILYLSETVSKLTFQKPDKMKETIIASKVSGKDNGFSFNNAAVVDYDFYENYLGFKVKIISPLNDNAFNYYKFKIEGTFFNDDKQQINKIKVIPRRDTEPVVEGYIYILEDSWALYGVDLRLKGYRMQTPVLDHLDLKQNFSYNKIDNVWIKNSQTLDFVAGVLGINLSGKFNYVYSNFEFVKKFEKKTFTNEVLNFEKDANKKEDSFWNTIRPIPLTVEESTDYVQKDSIQTLRKSKVYLDSIDKKSNKFKLLKLLTGYQYQNSYNNWSINYKGFLTSIRFNTVQGYNIGTDLSYNVKDSEKRTFSNLVATFNYGFSENKLRAKLNYIKRFNNFNFATFNASGGSDIVQFNDKKPISNFLNTITTLFFKSNFQKLYHKNFLYASYGQEVVNGITSVIDLEYSERKPLFNNTNQTIIKKDILYTSNNPLLPDDEFTPTFLQHNLLKVKFSTKFSFGQKYLSRPDGKFNIPNDKYPILNVGYEKGLLGSKNRYNYDLISTKITYDLAIANKGNLYMSIRAGKFFNAQNISFIDYKHFNGNQTYIGQDDKYLNNFNIMPYYINSTNNAYFEAHFEHNDSGFFTNKIPLLNKLKTNLVLGYHNLSIPNKLPYQEINIGLDNLGWGKLKLFRIDYVRSFQGQSQKNGVVFGLKILNALD